MTSFVLHVPFLMLNRGKSWRISRSAWETKGAEDAETDGMQSEEWL